MVGEGAVVQQGRKGGELLGNLIEVVVQHGKVIYLVQVVQQVDVLHEAVPFGGEPGLEPCKGLGELAGVFPQHFKVLKVSAVRLSPGEGLAGEGHGIVPGLGQETVETVGLLPREGQSRHGGLGPAGLLQKLCRQGTAGGGGAGVHRFMEGVAHAGHIVRKVPQGPKVHVLQLCPGRAERELSVQPEAPQQHRQGKGEGYQTDFCTGLHIWSLPKAFSHYFPFEREK